MPLQKPIWSSNGRSNRHVGRCVVPRRIRCSEEERDRPRNSPPPPRRHADRRPRRHRLARRESRRANALCSRRPVSGSKNWKSSTSLSKERDANRVPGTCSAAGSIDDVGHAGKVSAGNRCRCAGPGCRSAARRSAQVETIADPHGQDDVVVLVAMAGGADGGDLWPRTTMLRRSIRVLGRGDGTARYGR